MTTIEIENIAQSMNLKLVQFPKFKRDFANKRMITLRDLANGNGVIKAGSIGTIDKYYQGAWILMDGCECCGFKPRITRVSLDDFRIVEHIDPDESSIPNATT